MADKNQAEIELLSHIVRTRIVNATKQLTAELLAAGFAQENITAAIDKLYPVAVLDTTASFDEAPSALSYGVGDESQAEPWPHDWPEISED